MATKISKKNPNPGVWFKFDESDEDSGSICIRALTPQQLKEMRKATVESKVEYKNHQRFEYEKSDGDKFAEMLWNYVIADWNKLEDDDGNEIECTLENKIDLMMNNIGFAAFVGQCRERVDLDSVNLVRQAEKN